MSTLSKTPTHELVNYSVIIEVEAVNAAGVTKVWDGRSITTKLEKGMGLKYFVEKAEIDFINSLVSIGYKVIRGTKFSCVSPGGEVCLLKTSWKNPSTLFH